MKNNLLNLNKLTNHSLMISMTNITIHSITNTISRNLTNYRSLGIILRLFLNKIIFNNNKASKNTQKPKIQ